MKETISSKHRWNEGAVAGLALGGFTIVMTLLSTLAARISGGVAVAALGSILKFLLWAAKFAGCIWLMRFFMLRLVDRYDGVTNQDTRSLGIIVALLSALVVAAYSMGVLLFQDPADMKAAMDTAMASYSSMLDSNTRALMDSMMGKLPVITFFSMFIYCWVFGVILSAILSRNIPSRNPFDNPVDEQ